jgi:hypothetical protein
LEEKWTMKSGFFLTAVAGVAASVGALLNQIAPTILEKMWPTPAEKIPMILHWARSLPGPHHRWEHVYRLDNSTKNTLTVTAWWNGMDDLFLLYDGASNPGPDRARSKTFENVVSGATIFVTGTSVIGMGSIVFTEGNKSIEVIDFPERFGGDNDFYYSLVRVGRSAKVSRREHANWDR